MIETSAIAAAAAYTVVGLVLVLVAVKLGGFTETATSLSIFFAPLVAYLLFSGQLSGFSGFGVELQLREATQRTVVESIDSRRVEPSQLAVGEGVGLEQLLMFQAATPVVLLKAHDADLSPDQVVSRTLRYGSAIYSSLIQGQFEMLVVVDDKDRFLGFFPRSYFLDLLRMPFVQFDVTPQQSEALAVGIRDAIQHSELRIIMKWPRQRAEAEGRKVYVVDQARNLDALKVMSETGSEIVVVTDVAGRYKGFVRRRDIIDRLLIASAEASQ